MSSHQPSIHAPNQARDDQKRDEARKEELERRTIEEELHAFNAHDFYEKLCTWSSIAVPQPVHRKAHISWTKKDPGEFQPIPVARVDFSFIHSISSRAGRLLYLLKSAEQKGMNCPYVHQMNKETLEKAVEKCKEIKKAIDRFYSGSSMVARLVYLLHKGYIYVLSKEIDVLLSRLEAIFLICRHEEFAQDLVHLRRAVTYRTGYVLGPETSDSAQTCSSANTPLIPKKKI